MDTIREPFNKRRSGIEPAETNLMLRDILLVLIGGVCSTFGGFFATWYRARVAGKVKFEETIAERKVAAYGKALEVIGQVQSILIQGAEKDALDFLYSNGTWFADNLILLPHTFVENWRSIRLNLKSAIMKNSAQERMAEGSRRDGLINDIVQLRGLCDNLAQEAETILRQELKLPACKIRHPDFSGTA